MKFVFISTLALVPSIWLSYAAEIAKRTISYGNPAQLTGPCFETSCIGNPSLGTYYCGVAVTQCTAGSIADVNPLDPSHTPYDCSYVDDNRATTGILSTCMLTESSGEVVQSGGVWLLRDSVSTISLDVRTPIPGSPTGTILYVVGASSIPASYSYFIAAASSIIAAGGATKITATSSGTNPLISR